MGNAHAGTDLTRLILGSDYAADEPQRNPRLRLRTTV